MTQTSPRGSATRNANMALRREKILETAREIIAESGFESLSLRELAHRSGVTVPTIYNLIGNKAAVVECLFDDSISPFEHLRYISEEGDLVAGPQRFFDALAASLAVNENYHRAEFLAREHMREAGDRVAHDIHERAERIAVDACQQARDAGLLNGDVSPRQLGEQIHHLVRLAFHDWAHGAIDLGALKHRLLVGTYLCLAADAAPAYRARLVRNLCKHDSPAHVVKFK